MNDGLGISGITVGGYQIDKCIGSGSFGYLYEAVEVSQGREVALKILDPLASYEAWGEFSREGTLLHKLAKSDRVVNYMGSGDELFPAKQGRLAFPLRFHILERAERDLAQLLAMSCPLTWIDRLAIFRDVVRGIHQMHLKKVVHRDLKASNCLLFLDKSEVTAKVSDLGRSRDLEAPAHAASIAYQIARGDRNHAAPELLWGIGEDKDHVHLCADLYGLGSLLVELAIGQSMTTMANPFYNAAPLSADVEERRAQYYAHVPTIRSQFETIFAQIELDLPASIRQQGGELLRRLCDPDPKRRLQTTGFKRGESVFNGAHWVLTRVDVLRLTLRNALNQEKKLALKKGFL